MEISCLFYLLIGLKYGKRGFKSLMSRGDDVGGKKKGRGGRKKGSSPSKGGGAKKGKRKYTKRRKEIDIDDDEMDGPMCKLMMVSGSICTYCYDVGVVFL